MWPVEWRRGGHNAGGDAHLGSCGRSSGAEESGAPIQGLLEPREHLTHPEAASAAHQATAERAFRVVALSYPATPTSSSPELVGLVPSRSHPMAPIDLSGVTQFPRPCRVSPGDTACQKFLLPARDLDVAVIHDGPAALNSSRHPTRGR